MKIKINFDKINLYKILKENRESYKENKFIENRLKHINFYKEKCSHEKYDISYYLDKVNLKDEIGSYDKDYIYLFFDNDKTKRNKVFAYIYTLNGHDILPVKDAVDLLMIFRYKDDYKKDLTDMINRCKNFFMLNSLRSYTLTYQPYNSNIKIEYVYVLYIDKSLDDINIKDGMHFIDNESIFKHIKEGIVVKHDVFNNVIIKSFDEMIKYVDDKFNIKTTYKNKKVEEVLKEEIIDTKELIASW